MLKYHEIKFILNRCLAYPNEPLSHLGTYRMLIKRDITLENMSNDFISNYFDLVYRYNIEINQQLFLIDLLIMSMNEYGAINLLIWEEEKISSKVIEIYKDCFEDLKPLNIEKITEVKFSILFPLSKTSSLISSNMIDIDLMSKLIDNENHSNRSAAISVAKQNYGFLKGDEFNKKAASILSKFNYYQKKARLKK